MKLLVAAAFVALVAPLQAIKASRGIHPNLAPLFNVRTDFARTDLDKFKGVAAKLDNVTNQIVVVNEVKVGPSGPSGHAAWAHLADRLNETGWMELHVSTPHEAFFSNDVKMYSAGLLEGLLSAERMSQFYSNFYPLLQPDEDSSRALLNIRNLFNLQVQHVMHQCGLSGGLGEEPEDPYWKQVRYLFLQMWGLKDAYNVVAQEKGVSTIDMVDMFFINSHAELGEMMQAYSPEATAARAGELSQGKKKVFLQMDLKEESQRKGENSIPVEVDRDEKLRLAKRGHCSALVRLAPSNGELLVGHTTWSDYSKMTRVFKYYNFHLPLSFQSSHLIALSSYPGCVSSTDDFYMLDSGLTVMDTTLEVLNPRVYDRISEDPHRPRLPRFLHVMAVNRVAKTGTQWTSMLSSESLGTGNSQWLVVDYNRFTPGQPLRDGALRLLEQLPGISHQADLTSELSAKGYWGSFNRPFFQDIRQMSGHEQAEARWGSFYSFEAAPRAEMLQRYGAGVGDLSGMRDAMTKNNPKDTVVGQPSGPGHAIMARLDLDAMVNNIPNGGIDAKVTNSCLLKKMKCQAISGPSHQMLPAFRWTSEVPSVQELIDLMRLALDEPDNVLKHIYALEQKVSCVWHAHFWDRRRLMVVIQEGGRASTLNATMERLAVAEFADKMQQVLGRFESVQDVLVMCLVRMLSCGNRALAEKCGTLLAQWVDATAEEMHDRIDSMSEALFRDLRLHLVLGIQSINERPMGLYEISAGTKKGQEEVDEIELEQIEETWHILTALSKFGPSTLYDRMISPWRARVLRPFLPVLCREPRDVLGPDLPFDRWAEYTGFDAFPGEAAEVIEVEMNLLSFQEKCSRQGFGGFVLEAASEDGMVKVYFKQQKAQSLASLRRRCATRTLHVRPVGRVKRTEAAELGDGNNYSWNAWVNSLAVLVSATADPHNAALCVSMDAHLAVVRHESDNQGFTEATLLGSSEAKNAFLRLLRLGRNLMSASGDAGVKAAKYFLEQGLHTRCWSRARRRLQEGGSPLPLARLSELPANDVALIGELVGVLITMMKCDVKEICDKAMADIKAENGLDVFDVLLQVAASTTNPDPFFLAIAYETIYVFLKNDLMRAQLLSKVISQLRETAILLPYIRGPYVKDAPNEKYMQLWCKCELKYGTPNAARDRLRQLHDSQDPDESSQWREMVPEIRDLQNPMMHRTLLGIVKIIQLLSELAQGEDSEALKPVTDLLDASGRERLLIGPTTGLVTCPDFDVRVESLKCVRNVLEATPEQFDLEEMGWLLNYLTSVGMGIGKQGLFLMEVIELIKMFVRNKSNTGQSFRNKFAKYAIRESFEMLTVNSRRETHNKEETTAKTALTQKIIELLMDCSRPLSGGLRKFLRRVDLMETIRKVLQAEEQSSSQVAALGVLQTWTGRDIRQVLLPIITSPSFHVHGDVVHTALIRLADVLQGKPDYKMNDIFQELPPSDESRPWLGVDNLHRHVSDGCDAVEMEDSQDQHEYFVNSRGLEPLLDFVGRFFSASEELNLTLIKCQEDVANELDEKEKNLRSAWEDHERRIGGKATGEQKNDEDQTLDQVVQECIAARLRALNEGAVTHFRQNLNHYDEKKGEFSLTKLAKVYQSYWKDNETRMQVEVQERPDAIYQLLRVPDKICVDQQLKDLQEMEKIGKKHQHVRQPHRDFDRLHLQAKDAHTILKTMLCDSASREHPEVSRWCNQELTPETPPSVLQTGLADFLQDNQAQAIDAGVMSTSLLSDLDKYKYFGRHDRRTNMSLVYLEFPNARGLWEALEELLKRAQRLFLWQVRNHFRIPTALGEYYIALKFQLQLKDSYSSLHYAELRLCLSGKSKKLNTIQMFRETMKKAEQILHESCAVPLMETALVAQFLTSMLRSRSIRHNDVVFLRSQDVNLEVDDQNVFAQSAELMSCQLFIIEREAGAGVVKAGDRIRLKSQFTHKYLDVHASSHLRCRLLQPDPDYNMTFTVEIVGCRDDYALSRVGMTSKLKEFRGVHVESTLKLKVNGLNCVTVRHGGANFLTSFGERLAVKSEPMDAKLAAGQVFTIYRDGAQVLDFHAPHQSGRKPVRTLAGQTSDEILQKTMMEAHMRTEISSTTDADEGSFRRVPPAFRTMMWSIAGHFRGEAEQKSAGPEASLRKLWQRGSKNMAAMLRCAYMLLEVPKAPGGRRYILEAFSTRLTRHSVLSRIISMVSALQVIGQRLNDAPDLDIACALLPKKFLRICDAAITNLPLCQSPEDVEGKEEKREQREQERHERELATLDRERLWTMSLVSSYACRCVVRPMLNRLQVADQRQLDPNELLVFADFANLMAAMVQSIFDNEMRCVTQDHKKKATLNGLDALPALQNGTGNGAAASAGGAEGAATEGAEDTGATQSDAMVVAADTAGALQPVEAKKKAAPNALSEDARATVVEEVIPPITIKALVHLFLYAIHQKAIAFRNGASSEVPVRLISAMINACIAALAAVMNLTGSSNALDLPFDSVEAGGKVSCDYDICEAVSQAMTEGAQLVPRARVAQLQVERGIDALRPEVQEMLQDGEFDFSYGVQKKLYSTERVNTISYVWTRNNKHLEERRSILVTTTRFRLFFLGFSEDGAMPRRSDLFLLSSVRDMRNIRRAVFSSRTPDITRGMVEEP